jgi:hypothetical protein
MRLKTEGEIILESFETSYGAGQFRGCEPADLRLDWAAKILFEIVAKKEIRAWLDLT